MIWNWLGRQKIILTKTWLFSAPDASKDICLACAVERGIHSREHQFVEKEKPHAK